MRCGLTTSHPKQNSSFEWKHSIEIQIVSSEVKVMLMLFFNREGLAFAEFMWKGREKV